MEEQKPGDHRYAEGRNGPSVHVLNKPHDERGEYEAEDVSACWADQMTNASRESGEDRQADCAEEYIQHDRECSASSAEQTAYEKDRKSLQRKRNCSR